MSIFRTTVYTVTGALCTLWILALLATHYAVNYTTPMRINPFIYQVETTQGSVLLRDVVSETMWLVSFDDCQLPLTATTVAKVNGNKTIVEFRQELGETLVLTILRNVTDLRAFSMDVPCMEGVRTIDLKFREHWTETP